MQVGACLEMLRVELYFSTGAAASVGPTSRAGAPQRAAATTGAMLSVGRVRSCCGLLVDPIRQVQSNVSLLFLNVEHGLPRCFLQHHQRLRSRRECSNQLVQLALGGRLLPTLSVLDRENHDESDR